MEKNFDKCILRDTHFIFNGGCLFDQCCSGCGYDGRAKTQDPDSCSICGGGLICDDPNAMPTCVLCGLESSSFILYDPNRNGFDFVKRNLYNRKFYLNEILKQWLQAEPAIPEDLFEYIKIAYNAAFARDPIYWAPDNLNREKIHAICRSISVDEFKSKIESLCWTKLSEEHSIKYKTKNGKPLGNFRKFGEKWRTIRYKLVKIRTLAPTQNLIGYVCKFYLSAERAFGETRHAPDCDGMNNCHHRFNCRHSMIAMSYIIKKALVSYYQGDKNNEEYKEHVKDWPSLSEERRKKIKRRYWYKLCKVAGPEFDLWKNEKPKKRGRRPNKK